MRNGGTGTWILSFSTRRTWVIRFTPLALYPVKDPLTCLIHVAFQYKPYVLIIVQRDATHSSLFIILQVNSTYFGCQQHPSSGVHKTITTASNVAKLPSPLLEGGSCTKNMTSTGTGGCSYSFVYSWWWVWLTPETCRVNLQNNK